MKRMLAICLTLLLILSLTACKAQDKEETVDTETKIARMFGQQPPEPEPDEEQPDEEEREESSEASAIRTDVELSPYLVMAKEPNSELCGYIDVRTGEYVIEPAFSKGDDGFGDDGWCKVWIDDSCTIINTEGEALFEPTDVTDVGDFGGDSNVAITTDKKAKLYHGAEYVCDLEIPYADYMEVETSDGCCKSEYANVTEHYTPGEFLVLYVRIAEGEADYLWYDKDGELIYIADKFGGMAADETGYYHMSAAAVCKIDFDGQVVERMEKDVGDVPKVFYDGDNWYACVRFKNGSAELYTNGMTLLFEMDPPNGHLYIPKISDGIVRDLTGTYRTLEGEQLYIAYPTDTTGFQNGYARVRSGGVEGEGDFCGFIDTDMNEVLALDEENFVKYSSVIVDGYFVFYQNGQYGIMDMTGDVVVPAQFAELYSEG